MNYTCIGNCPYTCTFKGVKKEETHSLTPHRTMNSLQALEVRQIVKKYLNEREPELRTKRPLPGDYEAFRDELHGEATDEAIIRFEDEWQDVYEQMEADGWL